MTLAVSFFLSYVLAGLAFGNPYPVFVEYDDPMIVSSYFYDPLGGEYEIR